MSAHSPSNQGVAPQDAGTTDAGPPLEEEQLEEVVGGTLRLSVRPILLRTPDYALLPDDTRQSLEPDMPPVDP